jgi:homoserine dehydrogenase
MNAASVATRTPRAARPTTPSIALLGTGTVGSAVLARLAAWRDTPLGARLALNHVANSRTAFIPVPDGGGWREAPGEVGFRTDDEVVLRLLDAIVAKTNASRPTGAVGRKSNSSIDTLDRILGDRGLRIVIDATASEIVAERHAQWLAQGVHVVTACKLGQGTSLARWRAIRDAQSVGKSQYGDSATVGAGLPLLKTIRALQNGGDRIHSITGVLSGSLAWLFNHYDGLRPFSGFVRQARDAGYTEPDPRDDLSGEDVRRKLLILSRAAGVALENNEVEVGSLVPSALVALSRNDLDAALSQLDAPMRERYAAAYKRGEKLRFIARLEDGKASVGLESLHPDHPLASGAGTDNRVAIWSDRYRRQPLVIQGPGAGAEVTAAALLDDALEICACHDSGAVLFQPAWEIVGNRMP